MRANFHENVATVFHIGHIPFAPGTFGSLPGLALAWLLIWVKNSYFSLPWGYIFLLLSLFVLSYFAVYCIDKTEKKWSTHDPKSIVIDEVLGQALTLVLFEPSIKIFCFGFLLFRFFDILKPWPIRLIDRRVNTPFGTLADDLVAGFFAAACLKILLPWL